MRTFTFSDEKSHKFWNVELSGNALTVTYGRVGAAGQTQTKTFADAAAAQKEHDKLVKEKLAKGYAETTPTARPAASSLREALEEALVADPNDRASHMAYADHLTESGDPRGEFVQVQLALEDETLTPARRKELQKREQKLLKAHGRDWLGDLAPFLLDQPMKDDSFDYGGYRPHFAQGWLDALEVGRLTVAFARILARAPQARLLRCLRIVTTGSSYSDENAYEPGPDVPEGTHDPSLHPLARSPYLGNVRVLQVGESASPDDTETYYNSHASAEGVLGLIKKMPKLEELYLLAHEVDTRQLFALKTLHCLRILQVYHRDEYPFEALAKNPSLGNLTHLMCHPRGLQDDNAYIRLPGLRALVNAPHLKSLTHLHLHLTDFGDKGAAEVVRSGVLKRLKVLDLAGGCITDDGARTLAACPDLRHLEYLDLRKNALTKAGIAVLKKTGVKFNADSQWTPSGEESESGEYLYEGDCE